MLYPWKLVIPFWFGDFSVPIRILLIFNSCCFKKPNKNHQGFCCKIIRLIIMLNFNSGKGHVILQSNHEYTEADYTFSRFKQTWFPGHFFTSSLDFYLLWWVLPVPTALFHTLLQKFQHHPERILLSFQLTIFYKFSRS